MKRFVVAAGAVLLLTVGLTACSSDGDGSGSTKTTLVVLAASSLTNPFGELEKTFEKDHPDVDVEISYDSSSTLATSITNGAPADVLATADQPSMQIIVDAGDNGADPVSFASNTMAIVTPPDNPAQINSIDDLPGTEFVMCDPSAPCGAVATQILKNAKITAQPVSLEDKVTAVLTKVESGDADAGFVYVSDAAGAGDSVSTVDIPANINVTTPYYIAPVKDSKNADLANEWIQLVQSPDGQKVLKSYSFGPPAS